MRVWSRSLWVLVVLGEVLLGAVLATAPVVAAPQLVVSGRVVLPGGVAAAAAVVEMAPLMVAGGAEVPAEVVSTRTARSGHFQLEVPAVGMWALKVQAPGGPGGETLGWEEAVPVVEAVGLPLIVLKPPPAAASSPAGGLAANQNPEPVRGRLLDAVTRQPLASGVVWLLEAPATAVLSDAGGRFEFPARSLPVQGGRLGVVAAGHLPRPWPGVEAKWEEGTLLELLVEPAVAAAGTVVDTQGQPLPEAEIRALPKQPGVIRLEPFSNPPLMVADAEGRFRLVLAPEASYTLQARVPGYAPTVADLVAPAVGQAATGLRLVLAPGLTAAGQVVSAGGAPVAGARVSLLPTDAEGSSQRLGAIVARALSDASGRFELTDLAPGHYVFSVQAPGFAFTRQPVLWLQGPGVADLGTVALVPGRSQLGCVTDGQGTPVADVFVSVEGQRPHDLLRFLEKDPNGFLRTGEDGCFTAIDLHPDLPLKLHFHREGYVGRRLELLDPPQDEPLAVVLDAALELIGRVLGPEGTGIARAHLVLLPQLERDIYSRLRERTEDDGTFRFADVPAGSYRLQASAEGFRPAQLEAFELKAGEPPPQLTVRLDTGAVLEGRILKPDGEPAMGAYIASAAELRSLQIHVHGPANRVRTDQDGHYQLAGLEPGPMSIQVFLEGYARLVKEIELLAGHNRLDLVLDQQGVELSGRVVDGAGEPLARVPILLTGDSSEPREAESDSDGAFVISGLLPGNYLLYTSYAFESGYVNVRDRPVVVEDEPIRNLELQLRTGGRIQGHVRGFDAARHHRVEVHVRAHHVRQFVRKNSFVLPDGSYELTGLEAGDWQVIASSESGGQQVSRRVAVADGGSVELDLELEPAGDLTLTGQVLLGGKPLADASVGLQGPGGFQGFCRSDLRGRFVMQQLAAGAYQLSVRLPISDLEHRQVLELQDNQDVVIEVPTASIAGTVVGAAGGSPLASATIILQSSGSEWREPVEIRTGSRGDFLISQVPVGRWRLLAQVPGYGAAARELELGAGDAAEVELQLSPSEGLQLTVVLPSGLPAAFAFAALLDAAGQPLAATAMGTSEGGRLHLDTAPPGRWQLVVSVPEQAIVTLMVDIPGHAEVRLPPSGDLRVLVPELLASGASSAEAQLLDAAGNPYGLGLGSSPSVWPLFDGHLRLPAVPAGRWRLVVTAADGRTWTRDVEVVSGLGAEVLLE